MSNPIIPADELFQIIASPEVDEITKLEHIQRLKSRIKKGFVDLSLVPKYFDSLAIAVDIPSPEIRTNSLSTLSYLIKRISVQDKRESLLKQQSTTVVPILISKLADPSSNIVVLARNALENYWMVASTEVEDLILKQAFINLNSTLAYETVIWINHIANSINPNFRLGKFIPTLVKILATGDQNGKIDHQIRGLLDTFYSKSHNKAQIQDLVRELQAQKVTIQIQGETFPHITKPESVAKTRARSQTPDNTVQAKPEPHTSNQPDFSNSLNLLLQKTNYELDQAIEPENINDSATLLREFNSYLPCFQGKETESNWKIREKNIIHMRSILRGNARDDYRHDLLICFKDLSNGIIKAISSLRTTLSMHGCQLLKECAMLLQSDFDAIAELVFPTLIKLCSSTKNITSNNANMCIASFYANISYSPKALQRIVTVTEERNYQPRSYTAIWLQVILLRYADNSTFRETHATHVVEIVNKVLTKLLRDANPNVRSVAKDCFWTYGRVFPDQSEKLLSKLDSNTTKALQRSRPSSRAGERGPVIPVTKPQRTSLRESIIEKKREMRSRSSLSGRSTPDISSTQPLPKPLKSVPTRLGAPLVRSTTEPIEPTSISLRVGSLRPANPPTVHKDPVSQTLRESTTRSHSFGSIPKVEPPKPVSNPFTYTSDQDPLVNFLSSQDTAVVVEGISLLKFAVTQEELPKQVRDSLKRISIKQPFLLKPLFMANDKTFKASAKLFSPSDFLRLCSLLFPEVDAKTVDLIISCTDVDTFYDSAISLLLNVADTSHFYESQDLIMQLVKHKTEIARSIMQILSISLGRAPIADVYFSKFLAALFDLVISFKMTDNYQLCCQLVRQLYATNNMKFLTAVEQVDQSTREEIEYIVGIDSTFNLQPLSKSIYDLTEIPFQKSTPMDFSPVKVSTDFTMIRPARNVFGIDSDKKRNSSKSPAKEPIDKSVSPDEIQFEPTRDPVSVSSSANPSAANLVENFASVQITDENSRNNSAKSSIEAIMEKIDPLKSISNKSKKIAIYEDNKIEEDRSTDEVSSPSFEDYHIAKIAGGGHILNAWSMEQFESCCKHLTELPIDSVKVMRLIGILGSLPGCDHEVKAYFNNQGKHLLEANIWVYFEHLQSLPYSDVINGLVLLKQNVKYNETIDMDKLFKVMESTCMDESPGGEIHCIWDSILQSIYSKERIEEIMLSYLETPDLNTNVVTVCFEYFTTVVVENHDLSSVQTQRLVHLLSNFLESSNVDLLRLATVCYGKLLVGVDAQSETKTSLNEVKMKLPFHQQKLIEYYMK
ncbi:uncharacterized protein SPAPADRAFT_132669 [Spathaspora passalidarum NRRL Y-27907]|uniref:Protein STU1 n=1 Tax=Spathaspora passalidarum (strain NRRL Y-27907 / 11-Y1) TaxID=619300 RepID=G3AG64_SPAPN|nr:uncharacterized protein SPAPADRAFT_132669 [Spathaspora passalidarum NRRL Y-27907]EGW35203.1 hypothetical protein SPAPADRAFT_132669 [Spathaspora passalidarum NRRL Y-27907]